jgi:predicted Rossmann fold nucleotide-binding protein DprA/Smf involved in DNA uptake
MGKKIFVAPNQLFAPNGKGSNALLSTGKVKMLNNFDQILEYFGKNNTTTSHGRERARPFPNEQQYPFPNEQQHSFPNQQHPFPNNETIKINPTEQQALQRVKQFPNQELSLRSTKVDKEFGEILSQLTLLEMKGIIKQSSPGYYEIE